MLLKKEYNNRMKSDLSKTYFVYFLILVSLVLVRIIASLGVFSFLGDYADYIFTLTIQVFILLGFSVFLLSFLTKKKKKDLLADFSFKKIRLNSVIICLLIGVIVYFLNSYIASFFYYILSLFGFSLSGNSSMQTYPIWLLILNLIFTAILPAVCEETVHRGMLLSQIKKKSIGFAIVISSLLFGLLHINIYQFFYASILGLLLAVLTISTNSIYPAMIVHFMNNALNVYMSFASVNNLFSARLLNSFFAMANANNVFGVLFLILFFLFLLFALFNLYQILVRQTTQDRIEKLQDKLGLFLARKFYFQDIEKIKEGVIAEENSIDLKDIAKFLSKNEENLVENERKTSKNNIFYEKLFLFGSIGLSVVTTLFTLIWGII